MTGETVAPPCAPRAGGSFRARPAAALPWAVLCALAVFAWQGLTVRYNYGGDWSALFCAGENLCVPPAIGSENIHRFPRSNGWDGQFYHYIAHDPLLHGDLWKCIDAPRLRYRRILLPGLAFLLAGGDAARIDWAYRITVLLFFFFGAWCLARLAQSYGRSPAWALGMFFLPASIVSIDRMAVDVSLAALCLAFVLCLRTGREGWQLYAVLVAAALARDTGMLLAAGYCIWLLTRRKVLRAAVFGTAVLPALAWYAYVIGRTVPYVNDGKWAYPLTGVLDRFIHPMSYPFAPALNALLVSLDWLAAAGVLLAFFVAFRVARRGGFNPVGWAIVLFVMLALFIWRPGDWLEAFDYGRILSPLLLLIALDFLESGRWLALAPVAMVLPRFGLQMGSQVWGVVKGLSGSLLT